MRAPAQIDMLDGHTAPTFGHLTFAGNRPSLERLSDHEAAGARVLGLPVGLGLARLAGDGESAQLASIVVAEPLRRRGIGRALLVALVGWLASRGCRALSAQYPEFWSGATALTGFLGACGWPAPEVRAHRYQVNVVRGDLGFLPARPIPPGVTVVPWRTLSERQLASLRCRLGDDPRYADTLQFMNGSVGTGEVHNLAALESDGVIASLQIRVLGDVLEYDSLWVRGDRRRRGVGLMLIRMAAERGMQAGVTRLAWIVRCDNPLGTAFAQACAGTVIDEVYPVLMCTRTLPARWPARGGTTEQRSTSPADLRKTPESITAP